MTSMERRLSEDLRAFADLTVTEGDIMQARQQLQERVAVETQRRTRTRLVAVAAAIAACVIGGWWLTHPDAQTGAPPTDRPTPDSDQRAESVATSFVEAYAAFDVQRVSSFLGAEAELSGLGVGADWRVSNRFLAAIETSMILEPCTEVTRMPTAITMLCPFDYDALGSDELGHGPFGGSSFEVIVSDGRVVAASMSWDYISNTFSQDMWEPFATWVSTVHPKDAATMYADWPETTLQRLSAESIQLWDQHTRGYVDRVLANRAAAAPSGPG